MLLQAPRLIIAGGATALNIQRKVDRGKIATHHTLGIRATAEKKALRRDR
ncbi:MAG: hypothetical protein H6R26_2547 [Proteobacteria bacterium]|nr:hypothetical protein [Pseudomonadota bacterium]